MKILFKDDEKYYYISNNVLYFGLIEDCGYNLAKITHLYYVDIIYHIMDSFHNMKLPIYFRLNDRAICRYKGEYIIWHLTEEEIKNIDYIEVNIKKLEDGNII